MSKQNYSSVDAADDENFTLKEIVPGVHLCREVYYESWNRANIYVIRGTSLDLIVDTGVGLWDLPSFLRAKGLIDEEGGKPHVAVATHIHFDHSGGLHQFRDFAIHRLEADAIRTGDSYEAVCFMSKSECGKPPRPSWRPRDYRLRSSDPTRVLEDGDVFDLGDRKLRAIHLPGHSRGSVALFDEERGHFFSGDVIYEGPKLDWLPFSSLEDNIQSIEAIKELAPRVNRVFPGHGDDFDGTRLEEIASGYLNVGLCYPCGAAIGKALATVLLKGRNTKERGPRCCYHACCCCLCVGEPIADT